MSNVLPIDLITTPIAVLNGMGLTTKAGLSADDPLASRHTDESYRVIVTFYDPEGRLAQRREYDVLKPGERRLLDLGAEARSLCGSESCLSVVHRVPMSICPAGADPTAKSPEKFSHGDFAMYRCMAQYGLPNGGHGGVIYETPPGLNATGNRRWPSTTFTFTSKVAITDTLDTTLLMLHYSVSPDYKRHTKFRLRLFDSSGAALCEHEVPLKPFTAATVSIAGLLSSDVKARLYAQGNGIGLITLVGWCTDAALLMLFVQTDKTSGSVSMEHAHPPQTYLLPSDQATRGRLKAAAIAQWDKSFGGH